MKQTINFYQFQDSFACRPNNFSYEGLKALYEYLIEYEDETGEEIELDPIAFCCEFTEFENLKDFQDQYSDDYETLEDIEEHTTVIPTDGDAFIIQDF